MTSRQTSGRITVLGAGSWGTALAIQFARAGHDTVLWGRDAAQMQAMASSGQNERYLRGAAFPPKLRLEPDLAAAVCDVGDILVAVPSHAFRTLLTELKPLVGNDTRLAWATKGFELRSGALPHNIVTEILGPSLPMAVLSGPTFASEVGAGLPTAMTVASPDTQFARQLAENMSGDNFRAYTSSDMIGVEVGGAVKNVLAIGAGISDGLGFGANTRVALITRGLVEMTRLGVALGGVRDTFMGLAGMGDLVLTCTDDQSRNRRMGLALAAGKTVAQAQAEIQQVVEGVQAAQAAWEVAAARQVEMPITEQVHRVIYEQLNPRQAVLNLMRRQLKAEQA